MDNVTLMSNDATLIDNDTLLGDMPIKFIGKNFVHLSISFKL